MCAGQDTCGARGRRWGDSGLGAAMQRHLLSLSVSSTPSRPPTQRSWSGCRDGSMCCLPQRKGVGNLLLCLSLSHCPSPTPPASEGLGELSGWASTSLCLEGRELSLDKPACLAALRSTSRAATDCLVGTIHVERFPCPGCLLHRWSQLQIPPAPPAPELGFHGECILVLHLDVWSFWEVSSPSVTVRLSLCPAVLEEVAVAFLGRDALKASASPCLGDRLRSFVGQRGPCPSCGSVLGPGLSHGWERVCPPRRCPDPLPASCASAARQKKSCLKTLSRLSVHSLACLSNGKEILS